MYGVLCRNMQQTCLEHSQKPSQKFTFNIHKFFVQPFDWHVVKLKLREDAWRCSKKFGGYERRIRCGALSVTVLVEQLQVTFAKLFHSSYLSGLGKGIKARR